MKTGKTGLALVFMAFFVVLLMGSACSQMINHNGPVAVTVQPAHSHEDCMGSRRNRKPCPICFWLTPR